MTSRSTISNHGPVMVDGAVFFTATHIDGLGALGDVPERD
jgi:hypothetical protein